MQCELGMRNSDICFLQCSALERTTLTSGSIAQCKIDDCTCMWLTGHGITEDSSSKIRTNGDVGVISTKGGDTNGLES